ncbi:CU044_5270 family protein [Actinoplanes sp. NPDC023714]|uniref:CU044_5270 family protein n=1 Tax=Actinoplanes sp. NPDC023714 TaxID=3154322 RepID=UPI0033C0A513
MNDLDLMARFRDDVTPMSAPGRDRARARVMAEAAGTAATSRPAIRWTWRLAPVGVLAAALTAVVLVNQSSAPTYGPIAGPSAAGSAATGDHPTASDVLLLAAAEARRAPVLSARPDQFVFTESIAAWGGGTTEMDGTETYRVPVPMTRRIWQSVDGEHDGLLRQVPVDPKGENPLPELADSPIPACGDLPREDCGTASVYRTDLPTEATAMRAYIYNLDRGGQTPDYGAFENIADQLRESYVPPASLGALFEAAATIPGVTVLPARVELAGRTGIAVARADDGFRKELVFDPETYEYLGERLVAVRTTGLGEPAGTVAGYTAQLRVAVVDKPGQLP